jgi:hypothetical protein
MGVAVVASSLTTAKLPDLIDRSQLDWSHEAPQMALGNRHAAIEPGHHVVHDRVPQNRPVPALFPTSKRSAVNNGSAVTSLVRSRGLTCPLSPIPIAVPVGTLGVSVPPDYWLIVHGIILSPVPDRRRRWPLKGRLGRAAEAPRLSRSGSKRTAICIPHRCLRPAVQ